MKASEIKALSAEQRSKKLAELKEELFNLHFQQAINQLDNPMRIKAVKKDIARIKTRVGIVTSDKMDKTVVVTIKNRVRHPLYNKIVNDTVKYKAHDENNECGIGDKVLIMECRPYSKDKRWRVVEIVEKAK